MEVKEPDVVLPKTLHPKAPAGKSLGNKPSLHRAVREGIRERAGGSTVERAGLRPWGWSPQQELPQGPPGNEPQADGCSLGIPPTQLADIV